MGERGHPPHMSHLGCMGKSRPCMCSTAGVWLYICVDIRMVGFGAPASCNMLVIMDRGTDGNALATLSREQSIRVKPTCPL